MGTRSLTIIQDEDGSEIAVLYRQFDGYPEGHGAELRAFCEGKPIIKGHRAELRAFCEGKPIINGIPVGSNTPKFGEAFNGITDLAAAIVSFFKKNEVGEFYLHPPGYRNGEDWRYYVYPAGGKVEITQEEVKFGSRTPHS